MFKHCGQLVYEPGTSEDKVMEVALEAGAEDIVSDEDGSIEVITPPNDFIAVKEAMEAAGLKAVVAEVIMKPSMETIFTKRMAHIHYCALFVISKAINDNRRAVNAVAFVANFFVVHTL